MEDLYIIKIGGETLGNPTELSDCLEVLAKIDKKVILVHGGGRKVSDLATQLGIPQQLVEGRRITTKETLELCTMVYAGLINKNLVAKLSSFGQLALGLSGADLQCIQAKKRVHPTIDYGQVGEVRDVDENLFIEWIVKGILPVVSSITLGEEYELLNTNADTLALEIALSLISEYKVHLVYCFGKKGVLQDVSDENSLLEEISHQKFLELKTLGQVSDGMIPKLHTAYRGLYHGVEEARILHSSQLGNYFLGAEPGTHLKLH